MLDANDNKESSSSTYINCAQVLTVCETWYSIQFFDQTTNVCIIRASGSNLLQYSNKEGVVLTILTPAIVALGRPGINSAVSYRSKVFV